MKQVYRKSALERIASPEQLDKALKVTSPMSWLALLAIAIIIVAAGIWSVKGTLPVTITSNAIIASPNSTNVVYSDIGGKVLKIHTNVGARVYMGDLLATVQTQSGDVDIYSDQIGTVSEILVEVGKEIGQSGEVLRISPALVNPNAQVVVCYASYAQVKNIKRGMEVYVNLTNADSQKYGHMQARVINIDARATGMNSMNKVLGSDNSLSATFTQNGAVCAVTCELYMDPETMSGYYWSNEKGKKLTVSNGSLCTAKIIVEEVPPISKLITKINEILGDN